MCKSIDVAVAMINRSIERASAENNPKYYMDFVKLHKLMYLGQCYILSRHGIRLFEETISAHHCGPYVSGLNRVTGVCGFSEIVKKITPKEFNTIDFPLSFSRRETVDLILDHFGTYDTDAIVKIAKETSAYQVHIAQLNDRPEMSESELKKTGQEILAKIT